MTDTTLTPIDWLGDDKIGKRLRAQCRNVDEEFLSMLVALAHEGIPRLPYRVEVKAQDVFGREFWELLENYPRRLAGEVLARLVVRGKLALRFVSCPRCTKKVYMRR